MPDEIPVFELKWEEDEMWVLKIMKLSGPLLKHMRGNEAYKTGRSYN